MTTWAKLPELTYSPAPKEPVVTFSRQSGGYPRMFFNKPACDLIGLAVGQRIEFLAPPSNGGRIVLGLERTKDGGAILKQGHSSQSLFAATAALPHLREAYRKIAFRPRKGAKDEPAFVLEALTSEKSPWQKGPRP